MNKGSIVTSNQHNDVPPVLGMVTIEVRFTQNSKYAYEFYLGHSVSDVTWNTLTSLIWAYRILSFLNYLKRGFQKYVCKSNLDDMTVVCVWSALIPVYGGTADLIRAKHTCHLWLVVHLDRTKPDRPSRVNLAPDITNPRGTNIKHIRLSRESQHSHHHMQLKYNNTRNLVTNKLSNKVQFQVVPSQGKFKCFSQRKS